MRLELEAKSFGGQQILGPLRLTLRRGERVAILGPSGVGKSTLLRILLGLDRDWTGLREAPERLVAVFQEPLLLPWRDATANVAIPAGCDRATARAWIGRVGLAGHESHYPHQMSLGQQRRLALARAFAARPDILLMDEPFASLDAETAARMVALTDALLRAEGAGLLIVTHDPDEATALGARPLHLAGRPARLQKD